jgi:hypothetical protein
MKARLVLCSLAMIGALSACKVGISPTLYLSDIREVIESGSSVPVTAIVAFESPGADKCEEVASELLPALAKHYGRAEYKGCERRDFDTFVLIEIETEMVREIENSQSDSDRPIYIGVFDTGNGHEISIYPNSDAMKALMSDLSRRAQDNFKRAKYQLEARIINDGRGEQAIVVSGAFVDNNPVPHSKEFALPRRGEVMIRFSDVSNAAFSTGTWALIAILK